MQCRSVGPPPLEAVASATKSYLVITKKDFSYVQLCTPHCPLIDPFAWPRRNPFARSLAPPKNPFNDPVPKPDWQGSFKNVIRRQSAAPAPHSAQFLPTVL